MLKGISLNDDRAEKTIEECIKATNPRGRFQVIVLSLLVFECIAAGYVTFQMQSLSVLPEVRFIKCSKIISCVFSKLKSKISHKFIYFRLFASLKVA